MRNILKLEGYSNPPVHKNFKQKDLTVFGMVHIPVFSKRRRNCKVCYAQTKKECKVMAYCSAPHCNVYLHCNSKQNCFKTWYSRDHHKLFTFVIASMI